jgi:hypothetical protein
MSVPRTKADTPHLRSIVVLLLDPENLQSLCLTCDDKVKQSHERSRFLPMGADRGALGEVRGGLSVKVTRALTETFQHWASCRIPELVRQARC